VPCDEAEVCDFSDALELHLGQTEAEWRRKVEVSLSAPDSARTTRPVQLRSLMFATGSRPHVMPGMAPPSSRWSTASACAPSRRGAVVVINGIDREPAHDDAVVVLDWVARFRGDRLETRGGLVNRSDWNGALSDDLAALRDRLREQDLYRVLMRGSPRLPAWFGVGAALRDVARFDVAMRYHAELWGGDATAAPLPALMSACSWTSGWEAGLAWPWRPRCRAIALPTCGPRSEPCPRSADC
jgi:hypothetical protein